MPLCWPPADHHPAGYRPTAACRTVWADATGCSSWSELTQFLTRCRLTCCVQDRVGPPPAHREVQWLEPYICGLNDERGDVGFPRDVKSVRCTILGRPVRIRWAAGGQLCACRHLSVARQLGAWQRCMCACSGPSSAAA